MQADNEMTQKEEQKQQGRPGARSLNTLVIALVCLVIGVLIGKALFEAPPNQAVSVDEAQLRAIIESVLNERDAGAATAEDNDRFALVDDDPYLARKTRRS